jgi:hypothetical protein
MNFFYAKVSCPKSGTGSVGDAFFDIVDSFFIEQKVTITLTNIPNNLDKADVGDLVVLHVGGDNTNKKSYFKLNDKYNKFQNAVLGACKIISVGRADKSLKVEFYPFSKPVTKHDLIQYPIFMDNFGPLTKGSPNQAGLFEFSVNVFKSFIDYLFLKGIAGLSTSIFETHHVDGFLSKELERFYSSHVDLKNDLIEVSKNVSESSITNIVPAKNGHVSGFILPKPFLLLAGLSGTGKSRFVSQQAEKFDSSKTNYCLVSVRPDWHDPSDLLGYVSRLGNDGSQFITTDVLRFMVKAWLAVVDLPNSFNASNTSYQVKDLNTIPPFWLCLDEMNLAPVEQYFADYLSVIETRKWKGGEYTCDPLLKPDVFTELEQNGLDKLRDALGLTGTQFDGLWTYFIDNGISIPFNLIVAGTVNMDETTHGFSRKVIDRALTFDFGEFFPNDSKDFFNPTKAPKAFGYPIVSQATQADLGNVTVDKDGKQTITFFNAVNVVLKGTMFELAYRALNELLVSVICVNPTTEKELQAVWDDFLMGKVLPRIEGDEDKLTIQKDTDLLKKMLETFNSADCLQSIWEGQKRPDLFRESIQSPKTPILIACRSRHKLEWMQKRLIQNGFTSFWP